MTALAAALAALAGATALTRTSVAGRRLGRLAPPRGSRGAALNGATACLLAGVGLTVLVGLPVGLVAGGMVAVAGPRLLARLEPAGVRRDREALVAGLPLALDLLAACLTGGAAGATACAAVGRALPGPCGRRLLAVAEALAVGTAPREAWLVLADGRPDDPLAPAARLLARAAESGAPVAATVRRLAEEARSSSRAAGAQAARRVGVLVVAPLGLCFLPAFVLLGVVPVVAGLAGPLLSTF